jgi:hypothetical protein
MEEVKEIKEIKNKYECEKCNYKCKFKSEWEKHINTELHKTGIRKKRSDYIDIAKCEKCNYKVQNKIMMKEHYLNEHANRKQREDEFKYYCKNCDYGTYCEIKLEKHKNTKKHEKYQLREKE